MSKFLELHWFTLHFHIWSLHNIKQYYIFNIFYTLAPSVAVGRFIGFSRVSTVLDLESDGMVSRRCMPHCWCCHGCCCHAAICCHMLPYAPYSSLIMFSIRIFRWYSSRSFSESLLLTDAERDIRELAKKCGLDANTVDKATQDIQDIQDFHDYLLLKYFGYFSFHKSSNRLGTTDRRKTLPFSFWTPEVIVIRQLQWLSSLG